MYELGINCLIVVYFGVWVSILVWYLTPQCPTCRSRLFVSYNKVSTEWVCSFCCASRSLYSRKWGLGTEGLKYIIKD